MVVQLLEVSLAVAVDLEAEVTVEEALAEECQAAVVLAVDGKFSYQ